MFGKLLVYGFFFALGIVFERTIGFDRAKEYCREWWGGMGCCSGDGS
jgi:hypothetical protein